MFGISFLPSINRASSRVASVGHALSDSMKALPTDEAARHEKLATALKAGRCSARDWTDLRGICRDAEVKVRFFDNQNVQRKLVKALMMGNYLHEDIIQGLKECTPNISEEEQQQLFDKKFLWMMDGLQSRVANLTALRFFTNITSEQQNRLADAFHGMPDKTAGDYKRLAWNEEGAANLASTFNGRIRFEIARNLSIFTDPRAQSTAASILDKTALVLPIDLKKATHSMIGVGLDKVSLENFSKFPVLDLVIENLDHFTDPVARENVLRAIVSAVVDNKLDASKLVAVANKIAALDAEVRSIVLDAIPKAITQRRPMADVNAALSALTNPEAKQKVATDVANRLAEADLRDWWAEESVQSFFAQIINAGTYDADTVRIAEDAITQGIFIVKSTEDVAVRQEVMANANRALSELTDPEAKQKVATDVASRLAEAGLRNWLAEESVQSFFAQIINAGTYDADTVHIAEDAITQGIFIVKSTEDVAVRQEVMANANRALSELTDPKAKQKVATDVASRLAELDFAEWLADASVQLFFAQAIQNETLNDYGVISAMVDHLPKLIDDRAVQAVFREAVRSNKFPSASYCPDLGYAMEAKLPLIELETEEIVGRVFAPDPDHATFPVSCREVAHRWEEECLKLGQSTDDVALKQKVTKAVVQELIKRGMKEGDLGNSSVQLLFAQAICDGFLDTVEVAKVVHNLPAVIHDIAQPLFRQALDDGHFSFYEEVKIAVQSKLPVVQTDTDWFGLGQSGLGVANRFGIPYKFFG